MTYRRITAVIIALALSSAISGGIAADNASKGEEKVAAGAEKKHVSADKGTARFGLSTNLGDWAYLGTANLEFQVALASRWSLDFDARYNGWTYNKGEADQFQSRQQTYAVGARFWPWYTYSGWWVGLRGQYSEYNRGGLFSKPETEEGNAWGAAVLGGYSLQVNSWFDIDFGLGFWGGNTTYTTYACPSCGKVVEEGNKFFFLPDRAIVALTFVF